MAETRPGEGTRGSQGGRRLNTYDAGSDRHVLPYVLGGVLMEFQWLGGLCGGTELTVISFSLQLGVCGAGEVCWGVVKSLS